MNIHKRIELRLRRDQLLQAQAASRRPASAGVPAAQAPGLHPLKGLRLQRYSSLV
jgi:hypothetical protein